MYIPHVFIQEIHQGYYGYEKSITFEYRMKKFDLKCAIYYSKHQQPSGGSLTGFIFQCHNGDPPFY